MRILRKLAECFPEGKLRLTFDALNEIRWETLEEIEFMDGGVERLRMYLKYADFCNETFLDEEARDYYELVLEETLRVGVVIEEYRELAEYAYQRYAGLTFSDDDYVWETVSQRIEQYRSLFEKNRMQFNEYKLFPYNWETDEYPEKKGKVKLSPFSIEGVVYNIPPKIFNKPFVLEQIHLFYRSEERMAKWNNDNMLDCVLFSCSHANDLKFHPTIYGRRLRLLEDIQVWGDDESCLEGTVWINY